MIKIVRKLGANCNALGDIFNVGILIAHGGYLNYANE